MKDQPARCSPDLGLAQAMAGHFPVCAVVQEVQPLGSGLINTTFAVQAQAGHFVLQRINASVFANPPLIMDNLARLQQAIAGAGADAQPPRLPRFFATTSGELLARDAQGGYWRLLERIEQGAPLNAVKSAAQARAIGRLLGQFHRFGARLPVADYHVTLPQSHDTLGYRAALDEVVKTLSASAGPGTGDSPALDAQAAAVLEQVHAHDQILHSLQEVRTAGLIKKTLVHGDPKRDNVLFDHQGERALCLIDLDTVQPGFILYDIGDCLRSCCNRACGTIPEQVHFDAQLAEALLGGYAEAAPDLLSAVERELLFDAMRLVPLELVMRFLTDHLRGDQYFRVRFRGENLHKAIAQLALVADIERQEPQLRGLGRRLGS
ncbi:phosphotransferase enzyme family protein [Rhabdochromatium marinum]|uniref:phosphotransferase enzyme family protein n=1 Tax=Rhabdochromatium marinum TaxID=48729 RepID=UPI0019073BD7|nr:phosphotransferase [Rhabdochromatium marinum]MBK1649456.1 hypothetical protein [Rhabdochromatium marinum]